MIFPATAKAASRPINALATNTRVIPQHWCTPCGKQTWVVTFEEAFEIWAGGALRSGQPKEEFHITELHQVQTATGARLICLHSLFPNAF